MKKQINNFSKLVEVVMSNPRYCEFFKNLPEWLFDGITLENKIKKISESMIYDDGECTADFSGYCADLHFKNFIVEHSYQSKYEIWSSKNIRTPDYFLLEIHKDEDLVEFNMFEFSVKEAIQLIKIANNPELVNFL